MEILEMLPRAATTPNPSKIGPFLTVNAPNSLKTLWRAYYKQAQSSMHEAIQLHRLVNRHCVVFKKTYKTCMCKPVGK